MSSQSLTRPSVEQFERRMAGVIAAALGLFFLFGIGFAQPQVLHNAAHDTRHAFTFPCH